MRVSFNDINNDIISTARRAIDSLHIEGEIEIEQMGIRISMNENIVIVIRPDLIASTLKCIATSFHSVSDQCSTEACIFVALANESLPLGHMAVEIESKEIRLYMDIPYSFSSSTTALEKIISKSIKTVHITYLEHIESIVLISQHGASASDAISIMRTIGTQEDDDSFRKDLPDITASRLQRKRASISGDAFALLRAIVDGSVPETDRCIADTINEHIIVVSHDKVLRERQRTSMRVDPETDAIVMFSYFNDLHLSIAQEELDRRIESVNDNLKFGRISYDRRRKSFVMFGEMSLTQFEASDERHRSDLADFVGEHLSILDQITTY